MLIAAGIALLLRLVLVFIRGDYIVYDEGYYLLLARSLREGHGLALNGLPHVALSPLQPVIVAALSLTGLDDLWASRLLAAVCGTLLVFPVAWLATRWFGARAGAWSALFTAVCPPLLTFLPFFPGERWNLYFGSEPLYLVLAFSAVVAAMRTGDTGAWRWWIATGGLAALAYLTRLEGLVLAAGIAVVLLALRARLVHLALLPRALAGLATGIVIAAPYLVHLHRALGRWAVSGRVQAVASEDAIPPPAAAAQPRGGGSDAVREFVWGGNTVALWRTLHALDPSGTRMASQYWGVDTTTVRRESYVVRRDTTPTHDAPRTTHGSVRAVASAVVAMVPLWLLLGVFGLVRARPRLDAARWLSPIVLASLLPALLAYPEPRVLLPLAPLLCIGMAALSDVMAEAMGRRWGTVLPVLVALALLGRTATDIERAWSQQTPLQQVASGRRVVGEYLDAHLPRDARIVTWHPAIAIWAKRDWRVQPYEPFDRIVGYARAQGAQTIVFSRFEPSPLRDPPRAFVAVLLDSAPRATGPEIRLEAVDSIPQMLVGRLR